MSQLSGSSAQASPFLRPVVDIPPSDMDTIMKEVVLPSANGFVKPVNPNRCAFDGCKKKLSLTDFPCKCGKKHCCAHRPSEVHDCTYDYKKDQKQILKTTMGAPVVANKLDRI
jgi:hypothetical protein